MKFITTGDVSQHAGSYHYVSCPVKAFARMTNIMSNSMLADPKMAMTHQIDVIRDYARRMVMQGETLEPDEAADQMACMREFLTIGGNYGLTEKEMVGLVLGQNSQKRPACGCHSCNARKRM